MREFLGRRYLTVLLAIFFGLWYGLQIGISSHYGPSTAKYWFYFQRPPNLVSPGVVFAPISHDLTRPTHLGANILLLLGVGGFAEPHIGKAKLLEVVLTLGFIGTYITNVTALVHGFWILAGASGGILALWSYSALRLRTFALRKPDSDEHAIRWVERVASISLLIGVPVLLVHETLLKPNSGHVAGLILGILYFGFDEITT
jgi:membrane associated rhomboid family serine protease